MWYNISNKKKKVICVKVLIIEDEYSLADAIQESLKKEHLDVTIVTNGIDGEDEALTGLYDLILLDIMLPKKSGFEILKTLKEEKLFERKKQELYGAFSYIHCG